MRVEQFKIKPEEELLVKLPSRGASGLSLLYEGANDCISIRELPSEGTTATQLPGSSHERAFVIKGLKTGSAKIHFYETRIWNPQFNKISVAEIYIDVQ